MTKTLRRYNQGLLQSLERPALRWMAARTPAWVTPDHYTCLALFGAALAAAGYALSALDLHWLLLASSGLVLHWLGDSLDGSLARHRGIERPRYGYFLDNGLDLVALFLITIGVGLSGLVRWDLSLLALNSTLMMACLTFIRASITETHTLTYAGIGLTEMRVAGIGFNVLVMLVPLGQFEVPGIPLSYPNVLSLTWSVLSLVIFVVGFMTHLRELATEDPPQAAGTACSQTAPRPRRKVSRSAK